MKHEAVLTKLNAIRGLKFYFEPLGGNNGDKLIELGALRVFEVIGLKEVKKIEEAEVIVINGSGDLSYHPVSKPIEETRQATLLRKFSQVPIILLPSSCTPANAQRLASIVQGRQAPTILFARDAYSFSSLKELATPKIEVLLDHDMAFGLAGSNWLESWKDSPVNNDLLVVERFDAEGATALPMVYKTPQFLRSLVPRKIKTLIKKKSLGTIHANTPFIEEAAIKVKEYFPGSGYQKIKAADISLPQNHSFEEFCSDIAAASVVVSTRLHVCVLAALLGKQVVAVQFEGGVKLAGVFENSLRKFPDTKLWIRKKNQV